MIKLIRVITPTGEKLEIELKSPEKSGFFIDSIDGLGPSKSNVNVTASLYNDGAYYNSSRVVNRNIVLKFGFIETPTESIEQIRNKTYRFFPMKTRLDIEIEREDGLKVGTFGYVETNEPSIFTKESGTTISIVCPDAFFHGEEVIETTFSGVSGGFTFPFSNNSLTVPLIKFGNVFINTEANVFYEGNIPTGINAVIGFLGAVNNLTIHNITTGSDMAISSTKLIALTGFDFKNGDLVLLSTVKGNKFIYLVRNGLVVNILNTVSNLADWFTLQRGDNVFTYTASSGLSNIQFYISHRILYEGI